VEPLVPITVKAADPVPPQVKVSVLVPDKRTGTEKLQELAASGAGMALQLSTTGLLKPPTAVTVQTLVATPGGVRILGTHPMVKSGAGVGVGEGVGEGVGVGVGVGAVPVMFISEDLNAPRLSTTIIWNFAEVTVPGHEYLTLKVVFTSPTAPTVSPFFVGDAASINPV